MHLICPRLDVVANLSGQMSNSLADDHGIKSRVAQCIRCCIKEKEQLLRFAVSSNFRLYLSSTESREQFI